MKRRKVMIQVLYHGRSHLGIDSDEQAEIKAALRDELDISFLPSVQLEKMGMKTHAHAFELATLIIIAGSLTYFFLKSFAQGLGDELGRGAGRALKALGQKLWQRRRSESYSLNCDLVYIFTHKGIDCSLCIKIPWNQPLGDTSKALDEIFNQAPSQLKQLMHFIDENLDAARMSKDTIMPVAVVTTSQKEKGQAIWRIVTESKREVFYHGLSWL